MKLPSSKFIFTRPLFLLSSCALVATFFLPSHGLGIPACGFQAAIGKPCLGCGMTRALTSISHMEFQTAWHYHPFAFIIWPLMTFFGLIGLSAKACRSFRERVVLPYDALLTKLFWISFLAFAVYGIWRMLAYENWPY